MVSPLTDDYVDQYGREQGFLPSAVEMSFRNRTPTLGILQWQQGQRKILFPCEKQPKDLDGLQYSP